MKNLVLRALPPILAYTLGIGLTSCSEESIPTPAKNLKFDSPTDVREDYLAQFREEVGKSNDSRLLTGEEIREMPIKFFGVAFPEGTQLFAGVKSLSAGESGESAGFQVPPEKAQEFINQVRAGWEARNPIPAPYEKTVETVHSIYDGGYDGYGSQYSDRTVVIRFTSEDPNKKRWVDLNLDPVSGNGMIGWSRP